MTIEDICTTLTHMNMIHIHDRVPTPRPLPGQSIKTIKGRKSGLARKHLQRTITYDDEKAKGPFVPPTSYTISWDRNAVEEHLAKWEAKGYLRLRPENLKWSPFLIARAKKSDGLPFDDGTPQSATDAATPSTEALVTPLAGPSSDGGAGTASPAFALFDDDSVEIAGRSASSEAEVLPSPSEQSPSSTRSPQRSRRHRSTSPTGGESDVTPRPKRPRRSTAQSVLPRSASRRQSERPMLRRTRSVAQLPGRRDDADLIAEDAALAARLALEEDPPRRQLRSRSNTEQELPRPISPATSRSTSSPRKRKRAESPPATPPTARQTRSSVMLSSASRPTPTRRSSASRSPVKKRKPQRRPSRLTKEVNVDMDGDGDDAHSIASPPPDPDRMPEPPLSPTPSLSVQHTDADAQAAHEAAPDPEQPTHTDDARGPEGALAAPAEDEVAYEDTGTPFTGATSRQSVVHSDDTMVVAEEAPPGAHKALTPIVTEGIAELPARTLPAPNGHIAAAPPAATLDSGDLDLDAEGEEDAEGDIDAEGEDDIDAEGEPDTGEDLELELY
ncbi:hypothetical protein PHLGIDRAFT_158301 [Phlebiopsis gigantea 11061_1 CR5-6]|uniref:Uncharacterized protein n=1 Tax=Phlebiopsis gigantea (strain 11061_1 CR5-6) TaxID=745531 RepID=A0A0C3S5C1_PHLG1|nr:hypothetical protein PHLGIDRAFT_158301 [Phlebiopsis gigantea 11061_1 CR5-6]